MEVWVSTGLPLIIFAQLLRAQTSSNQTNVKPKPKDSTVFVVKTLRSISSTLESMRLSDFALKQQKKLYGGSRIRVLAIYEEVVVNYFKFEDVNVYHYPPGVAMELLRHIGNKYGIQYEISGSIDEEYGELSANGTWSGAVKVLLSNEADVVLGGFAMDYERSRVIDYSAPILHSETALLMRAPSREQSKPFVMVTRPFSGDVWMVICASVIGSGVLLKGLTDYLKDEGEIHYGWTTAIWVFYSIFVQQSLPATPKSWPCRTVLTVWWLGVLTLIAWFTGNMVAIFSVGNDKIPIQSADEFIRRVETEDYKIVTVKDFTTIISSLRNAKSGPERELYNLMTTKGRWINVTDTDSGLSLVKNNRKFILVGPKDWLEVWAIGDCNVSVVSFGFQPVIYALGFQKNSRYTRLFTDEIKRLNEEGFLDDWVRQYKATLQRNYTECDGKARSSSKGKAISLGYAQGVFWLTAVGCCTALGVLMVEFAIQKIMSQVIGHVWKPIWPGSAEPKWTSESDSLENRRYSSSRDIQPPRLRRLSRPLPDLVQFESRSRSFSVEL